MQNIVGSCTPEWGHTYLAEGFGKVYALRSLTEGSWLCLFDATTLAPIGEYPTPGQHSCHITLLAHQAVVADYTSGTLSLFDLDAEGVPVAQPTVVTFEGCGPHPTRQTTPHVHSSLLSRDGSTLYVVDLGTDSIYCFPVEEGYVGLDGSTRIALPAGTGPRMCVESSNGHALYVVTELSDEVLVLKGKEGSLLQRVPIAKGHPQGGGHILLSADGRTLYVSLRVSGTAGEGECPVTDGVAVFRVHNDALLTPLTYIPTGAHPRFFTLSDDDCMLCVACRDDDTLRMYAIDPSSGLPGSLVDIRPMPTPVCILWNGFSLPIVNLTR